MWEQVSTSSPPDEAGGPACLLARSSLAPHICFLRRCLFVHLVQLTQFTHCAHLVQLRGVWVCGDVCWHRRRPRQQPVSCAAGERDRTIAAWGPVHSTSEDYAYIHLLVWAWILAPSGALGVAVKQACESNACTKLFKSKHCWACWWHGRKLHSTKEQHISSHICLLMKEKCIVAP